MQHLHVAVRISSAAQLENVVRTFGASVFYSPRAVLLYSLTACTAGDGVAVRYSEV